MDDRGQKGRRENYEKLSHCTKMKFFIKDFFRKCDQIRRKLWIWSHLLEKSLMGNLIFYAVNISREKYTFLIDTIRLIQLR